MCWGQSRIQGCHHPPCRKSGLATLGEDTGIGASQTLLQGHSQVVDTSDKEHLWVPTSPRLVPGEPSAPLVRMSAVGESVLLGERGSAVGAGGRCDAAVRGPWQSGFSPTQHPSLPLLLEIILLLPPLCRSSWQAGSISYLEEGGR